MIFTDGVRFAPFPRSFRKDFRMKEMKKTLSFTLHTTRKRLKELTSGGETLRTKNKKLNHDLFYSWIRPILMEAKK